MQMQSHLYFKTVRSFDAKITVRTTFVQSAFDKLLLHREIVIIGDYAQLRMEIATLEKHIIRILFAKPKYFSALLPPDDASQDFAMIPVNDSMAVCFESFDDTRRLLYGEVTADSSTPEPAAPIIYFVTPTYPRREQIAEITRLGQTLMHVPYLHWIVADDTDGCNRVLNSLLKRFGKGSSSVNQRTMHYF